MTENLAIGNEVSVVYFLTDHQASIMKGRIHEINATYIIVMAVDTSTHRIYLDDIRTLEKK